MAVLGTDLLAVERSGVLHKATAADVAALGGGGGGEDPASPLIARVLVDDFVTQSTETGEVGFLNWSFTSGSIGNATSQQNHPGIQRRVTAATANTVSSMYLGGATNTAIFRFDEWDELTWIVQQVAAGVNDTTWQLGLLSAFGNVSTHTHGVYLEKLPADANWFFVSKNGGAQTRIDSGVAATTTAWINVKMRRVSATEVAFSINGGAEVSLTTNVPDAADTFNVGLQITPTVATARNLDMDFFSLKLLPVTR